MTVLNALEKIISGMEEGKCRALRKSDLKDLVYLEIGHYPKQAEFDKALDSLRKPVNKYKLAVCGYGFYRSATGLAFKRKLNREIKNKVELREAL